MEDKKEMSLLDLLILIWRKIKKGIRNIFSLFRKIFELSFRYFWIVVPITFLFAISGYFLSTPSKTIYNIDGIITFSSENRLLIENEFNAINALKVADINTFMRSFNLTATELSNLLEFKVFYVIDCLNDSTPDYVSNNISKSALTDTVNKIMPDMLGVRIVLMGTKNYKPYKDGLVTHFNNIKELRINDSVSKESVAKRIIFCQTELERLERFSEYDYFGGGKSTIKTNYTRGITIEPSRRRLYYEDMRDLIKEKNYLTNYMSNKKDVINFLSQYMTIYNFPRLYKLLLYSLFGFLISVIGAYAIDRFRKSK